MEETINFVVGMSSPKRGRKSKHNFPKARDRREVGENVFGDSVLVEVVVKQVEGGKGILCIISMTAGIRRLGVVIGRQHHLGSMVVLLWNCQGLGENLAMKNLKEIMNKNKPPFIFLMETKKKNKMEYLSRRRFKYSNDSYVDSIGFLVE